MANANEDAARIRQLVVDNLDNISCIYVTLDTHMSYHIAHSLFWVDAAGKHPEPWTVITKNDVEVGKWRTTDAAMQSWGLHYVTSLEKGKSNGCK